MSEIERAARIMGWEEQPYQDATWKNHRNGRQTIFKGALTDSGLVAIENRLFEAGGRPTRMTSGAWYWADLRIESRYVSPQVSDTREAAAIAALLALSQPEEQP